LKEQGWIEEIDQNVQRLLAQSALRNREVKLRSRSDLSLEIVVDGRVYQDVSDITDMTIRNVVKEAVDRWQNQQDQTETAAFVHTAEPTSRSTPFRSRSGLIVWLIASIFVLVILLSFIRPVHIAIRVGLSWIGAMLGGLIGVLGERILIRRVKGDVNANTAILFDSLGGMAGVLLGFAIAASILSLVP
jgi:hypothetical protein